MLTDVELDMEKQRKWFARISTDPTVRYWIIRWHDIPIGVLNLVEISLENRRCNGGFYLGDLNYKQLGAMIPPYLYNYIFRELKLNKIFSEVVASNTAALRMNRMHGWRDVGTYRQHVVKNGQLVDIVAIELLAETWLAQPKYARYVAGFEG